MIPTLLRTAPILLLVGLLAAACGDGNGADGPLEGNYVGQEIWITYGPTKRDEEGAVRTGRTREEARKIAERLHRQVAEGADIGELAGKHSNAPGGSARGFSGLLPVDRAHPSARDRAMASVAIGELTPVVEWRGGFWFARRISIARGAELERSMLRAMRLRVRIRVIALLYRGAWIADAMIKDQVTRSRAEAVARADTLLREIRAGASFEELARRASEDAASADNGGIVVLVEPDGTRTEWFRRQDKRLPASVLDAAFTTPVGEVHPEVIVSPRGVFLVKVEGRREVAQ